MKPSQHPGGRIHLVSYGTSWNHPCLLGLVLFLAAYNVRKRLPFLPIGRASAWLRLHVHAGVIAMLLMVLHTGVRWPTGQFEILLGSVFAITSLSGVFGLVLSRVIPRRQSRLYEQP